MSQSGENQNLEELNQSPTKFLEGTTSSQTENIDSNVAGVEGTQSDYDLIKETHKLYFYFVHKTKTTRCLQTLTTRPM